MLIELYRKSQPKEIGYEVVILEFYFIGDKYLLQLPIPIILK